MTDWIPSVVRIEKIEKHPNADHLSIATVMKDYPVIIRTNDYQVGQLVGYIPIDSIVPDIDLFYFLCPKAYECYEENGEIKSRRIGLKYQLGSVPEKYRTIKAKRILDIFSMGMLVNVPPEMKEGDSIIDLFQLIKLEEEEDSIPNAKKIRGANAAPPPKGWTIPYYDLFSVRKYISCLQENEEIILTEKLHGQNISICFDGEKLWIKSRRFFKKFDEDDYWWSTVLRYNLQEKLTKYPMKVLFGEIIGSMPKFKYDCEIIDGALHNRIKFFDIYDPLTNKYLDYDDFKMIINDLQLDSVPELYRGIWEGKEKMYPYAEGKTILGGKHIREGFVLRTAKERYEPSLRSRMCVKLVGEGYNLQK